MKGEPIDEDDTPSDLDDDIIKQYSDSGHLNDSSDGSCPSLSFSPTFTEEMDSTNSVDSSTFDQPVCSSRSGPMKFYQKSQPSASVTVKSFANIPQSKLSSSNKWEPTGSPSPTEFMQLEQAISLDQGSKSLHSDSHPPHSHLPTNSKGLPMRKPDGNTTSTRSKKLLESTSTTVGKTTRLSDNRLLPYSSVRNTRSKGLSHRLNDSNQEAGNGSPSGRDPSRTITENTQEEETTITLNQKKLLIKLVKCQDKNLKLSEEKSRCLEKLNVANEKVAALAIKLAESKDQQIAEMNASIPGLIEAAIRNNLPPAAPQYGNLNPILDEEFVLPVPPIPGVYEGVYPFDEDELDEMARGDGVNDFIRNLMRKLFTDNYLSTKTLTKMEKAHQTAIIDATMKRYPSVKRRAIAKRQVVNEDYVRRYMGSVFQMHHTRRKKQQQAAQ